MSMALPWNCSIDAIDSWLHNSNYGITDGRATASSSSLIRQLRPGKSDNHSWNRGIITLWGNWFGSRPAYYLVIMPAMQASSSFSGPVSLPTQSSGPVSSVSFLLLSLPIRDRFSIRTPPQFQPRADFQALQATQMALPTRTALALAGSVIWRRPSGRASLPPL
jgi:hypothetical protein